jgi:hypothetical protein
MRAVMRTHKALPGIRRAAIVGQRKRPAGNKVVGSSEMLVQATTTALSKSQVRRKTRSPIKVLAG